MPQAAARLGGLRSARASFDACPSLSFTGLRLVGGAGHVLRPPTEADGALPLSSRYQVGHMHVYTCLRTRLSTCLYAWPPACPYTKIR